MMANEPSSNHSNMNEKAIQWACKILESLRYKLKTSLPEIVQHTPWSYVVRFAASDGYIYLKQTPPAIALEVKISQVLHDLFDASTPTIIAANAKLNCFLMKDAGQSLRATLKKKFDSEFVCRAVDQFTSLQIAIAERVNVLLDLGVPDWRLENFPDWYKEVLSDKKLLMDNGLSEREINEAGTMIPKISSLCAILSSYSIKQTVVQPDCNDNNMLMDNVSKAITIIDLGEIAISHPFFSLLNFLHIMKKHHSLADEDEAFIKIKSAGLSPYLHFESKENLSAAFSTAQELWFVYGVLAHYRLMLACGKEKITSWQQGKLSNLFRGFMAV